MQTILPYVHHHHHHHLVLLLGKTNRDIFISFFFNIIFLDSLLNFSGNRVDTLYFSINMEPHQPKSGNDVKGFELEMRFSYFSVKREGGGGGTQSLMNLV